MKKIIDYLWEIYSTYQIKLLKAIFMKLNIKINHHF